MTGTFLCGRFIPAYAGNSLPVNPTSTEGPVHPRLRGELMVYGTAQDAAGFIPAYAGNSKSRPGRTHSITVHPRLRGELFVNPFESDGNNGSSPLTRGTLTEYLSKWPASRFIPAYAGNSLPVNPTSTEGPVHPRLRGELMVYGTAQDAAGFIPAYAGNSKSRPGRTHSITVHPRLRGELASCKCVCSHEHGSSPLTRGTQRRSSRGPYRRWFIPAYAGNSWIQCAAQRCSTVHPRLRGELSRYASSS